eukprot:364450-Chlamydomonas_euryale.AAC.4
MCCSASTIQTFTCRGCTLWYGWNLNVFKAPFKLVHTERACSCGRSPMPSAVAAPFRTARARRPCQGCARPCALGRRAPARSCARRRPQT